MNYIIAEALGREQIVGPNGEKLYCARALEASSPKRAAISKILDGPLVSGFLEAGRYLARFLKREEPVVFVTDWSDPTELTGLRLETEGRTRDYPGLCFLAFYTDWEDISASGIGEIFAHEFSHMWMNWLGMDDGLSLSNKFHTCTAITDFYMAFSEGFAEHLEIVAKDISGYRPGEGELWDCAFDENMWLCTRDSQLRYHAVRNNRFIYLTATPCGEDFDSYANLHMAHITSAAFTPERLKNGSQMMASEGVIAAFFYQMYVRGLFADKYQEKAFYAPFGAAPSGLAPLSNLYLKIFFALSKTDLTKPSLMTDFVRSYGECFPAERKELYALFAKVTHFATISSAAKDLFGRMHRVGRRGEIGAVREILKEAGTMKEELLERVLDGRLPLDGAVWKEIWAEGDEMIAPIPWEPDKKVRYRFNVNTATAIDFLSMGGVAPDMAEKLVRIREERQGYGSLEEFDRVKKSL